jgi:hypothetical protein
MKLNNSLVSSIPSTSNVDEKLALFAKKRAAVVLYDFGNGILLKDGSSSENVSARIGTDGWRAPEVCQQPHTYSRATDVFGLGLIVLAFYDEAGKPNSRALKKVPKSLRPLVGRMISINPAERPTAREFADACGAPENIDEFNTRWITTMDAFKQMISLSQLTEAMRSQKRQKQEEEREDDGAPPAKRAKREEIQPEEDIVPPAAGLSSAAESDIVETVLQYWKTVPTGATTEQKEKFFHSHRGWILGSISQGCFSSEGHKPDVKKLCEVLGHLLCLEQAKEALMSMPLRPLEKLAVHDFHLPTQLDAAQTSKSGPQPPATPLSRLQKLIEFSAQPNIAELSKLSAEHFQRNKAAFSLHGRQVAKAQDLSALYEKIAAEDDSGADSALKEFAKKFPRAQVQNFITKYIWPHLRRKTLQTGKPL